MKKKNWLKYSILIALGLVGFATFLFLLKYFYPYKAANIQISRSQAIQAATITLQEKGYTLSGFHVNTILFYDEEAFIFLQKKFGYQPAQDMVSYKSDYGFDFYWLIIFYKNLPRNAPQDRFMVGLSGKGNLVLFQHEYHRDLAWPRPEQAHLKQAEALNLAFQFLQECQVDTSRFHNEVFSTTRQENRTDHTFRWSDRSEFQDTWVELNVRVQGDEVGFYQIRYRLPEPESTAIKRQSGTEYFVDTVLSLTVLFLIGVIVLFIFLKKYHEGEVEVKTAGIIFWILMISFGMQALLRFWLNQSGWGIGEISPVGIAIFLFILLMLIIRPIMSIFGFTAWSVGESFSREKLTSKLASIDGLINKRFFTLQLARSILQGYCTGFLALGMIAVLFWSSLRFLGCTTKIGGFQNILPIPLAFILPGLTAITSALMGEILFRLFGNVVLRKTIRIGWLAVLLSAAFWAFYVPGFWRLYLSLYPIQYETLIWFILGIFYGIVFWKYDFMTVITANFITVGVLLTLPLITSSSDSIQIQGIISLVILGLPLIVMATGFIKRQTFTYKPEMTPSHIRRITERVRMSQELEIARQVQMRLLPKVSPIVPGFEISGVCIPAKEVGGDYFDFIELGDSRLGIVIGDVSGKGVPAAIYMTLTKGIVQSHADDFITPKDVLVKVNNLLYKTIDRDSFVSLFYAVLDFREKTLVYSRAGHNPLLHFHKKDGSCDMLEPGGIALGLERGELFSRIISEKKINLEPGDLMVFYTDGFTEAMNQNREEYGEERLVDVIQKIHDQSIAEIYKAILKDIKHFVKDTPQHDDMTVVLLKGI